MTLVDTSAWVEFLRGTGSDVHRRLRDLIRDASLLTTDPIVMELLAGARDGAQELRVRALLAACELESVRETDWEDAAAIYSNARRRGVTPREQLDCLIAAVAIRAGLPLLTADRDFELIADYTPLQLAR